jgi:hypothetical protein
MTKIFDKISALQSGVGGTVVSFDNNLLIFRNQIRR